MAENVKILSALRKLTAYYGKGLTKEQVELYVEMLAEVEAAALDYAVQTWITRSPFYPRISELLQTAARYTPPPASPAQVLLRVQRQLEWDFFQKGKLDPQRWEKLAQDFERYDRIYSAEACRKRFKNYQAIHAKVQEPPQVEAPI
jgi:hypothetical protein